MYDSSVSNRTGLLFALTAILIGVAVGCGDPKPGSKSGRDSSSLGESRLDSGAFGGDSIGGGGGGGTTDGQLPCKLLAGFPSNMDSIRGSLGTWVRGDDNCVVTLIDTLAATFVGSGDRAAIGVLDSLARIADGYVGDALSDASVRMLHSAPAAYLGYLVALGDSSAMRDMLVMGIRTAGADSTSPAQAIKAIEAKVGAGRPVLDRKRRAFLDKCLNRATPIVN